MLPLVWIISVLIGGGAIGYIFRDYDMAYSDLIHDTRNISNYIENAGGSIKIATDFESKFFEDENVKSSLEKALKRGVEIKFLTEKRAKIPEWYKNIRGIEIRYVEKLPNHFMVIGNGCVRLGKNKGMIYKDFPTLVLLYNEDFNERWKSCE
jgi:hypothetical protein